MYVEERIYTLQVGKAGEYFKNYEEFGMKVQLKHLPNMVGYYTTEVGELNLVIHMWAYDDLNERDRRRAAMQAVEHRQEAFAGHAERGAHAVAHQRVREDPAAMPGS